MAYNKQNFEPGRILKAEHLNNIENGIIENENAIAEKQDTLVSGTNIKTVNGESIVGEGNVEIEVFTKLSELENDEGFLTGSEVDTKIEEAKVEVPTKLSELENDKTFLTESEINLKIAEAQLGGGDVDLSSILDFTIVNESNVWTADLVDKSLITSGLWSINASAVDGVLENTTYSHTPAIDVSGYSKIAFRYKDGSFSWTKYTWGFWMTEVGVVSNSTKIAVQDAWDEEGGPEIVLDVPEGMKYIGLNFYSTPAAVDTRFYLKGFIGGEGELLIDANKIYPPIKDVVDEAIANLELNDGNVNIDTSNFATKEELEEFITESEVDEKIANAQLGGGSGEGVDLSGVLDFTVTPNFDAWTPNLVDRATIESGLWSINASAVDGVLENTTYSHTPAIDVSGYSKIAFRYKDSSFSWAKYTWGFWMTEVGVVSSANQIAVQDAWDEEGGPEIVLDVPEGMKYIGLNFYSTPAAVDTRFYLKGFIGGEGETFVDGNKIYPPIDNYVRHYYGEQYQGKKWVSFGDSITAQNTWQPTVAEKLGLVHVNCGIGSTCLGGATEETDLPRFWQDVRLNAVKAADPDVVTILGGANDLFSYIPVGETTEFDKALEEKDKSTFLGAYSYIIENLLTWKPTLKIIILTTTYAHNNVDKSGQCYTDFADASREVAHYYGLLCADLFRKTGFNKLTQSTYTKDGIHPNDLGGARIAEVVLSTMLEG